MSKENNIENGKGEVIMAVLASEKTNMFVIKASKAKDFRKESNENMISSSFLRECEEVLKIFKEERKK